MPKARLELEIDLDIWKTLKAVADPLIETPEMVMRQLLGLEKKDALAKAEAQQNQDRMTHKKDYYSFILRSLEALGGKAQTSDIITKVGEIMESEGKLTDLDKEKVPSGQDIRWRNMIRWAHSDLVEMGWLKEGSPRGVWELSPEGKAVLRGMKG